MTDAFEILDGIEYSRKDGKPLLATIYKPRGKGPFPALVSIHGGGWRQGHRMSTKALDEALARHGILVMAVDFRDSNVARYPESLRDVNLAVRWLKAHAVEHGATAKIGVLGCSSGGQQALMTGLRPRDPAFRDERSEAAGPGDAAASYIVACYPVVDPVGLNEQLKLAKPDETSICEHFFASKDEMAAGSPLLSVQTGRTEERPPILVIHGDSDEILSEPYERRFEEAYAKAGGKIRFELYRGMKHSFLTRGGTGEEVDRALEDIASFVKAQPT